MPLDRRTLQRLYLDILGEVSPETYALDFDTIIDGLLPCRKKAVVRVRDRARARGWIDELRDLGILVRDPTQDQSRGDFFILNPAPVDGKTALERFQELPPAPDATPRQSVLILVLVAVDVVLLFAFYSTFMPQAVLARLLGTVGLVSTVLGLAGLRRTEAGSFLEMLRQRKTLRWLAGITIVLVALLGVGVALPTWVRVVPGAAVYVDGTLYQLVRAARSAEGNDANAERWHPLWLPWGYHDITVSKRWFVDDQTWVPESAVHVLSLSPEVHYNRLTAFVHFAAKLPQTTPASMPGKPTVAEQVAMVMNINHEFFFVGQDFSSDDDHVMRRLPLRSYFRGSLRLLGETEADAFNQRHFLTVTCYDMHDALVKKVVLAELDDDHLDLRQAAEKVRDFALVELGMVRTPELEADWSSRINDLVTHAQSPLQLRQSEQQLLAANKQIQSEKAQSRQRDLLKSDRASSEAADKAVQALDALHYTPVPTQTVLQASNQVVKGLSTRGQIAAQAGDFQAAESALNDLGRIGLAAARLNKKDLVDRTKAAMNTVVEQIKSDATLHEKLAEKMRQLEVKIEHQTAARLKD